MERVEALDHIHGVRIILVAPNGSDIECWSPYVYLKMKAIVPQVQELYLQFTIDQEIGVAPLGFYRFHLVYPDGTVKVRSVQFGSVTQNREETWTQGERITYTYEFFVLVDEVYGPPVPPPRYANKGPIKCWMLEHLDYWIGACDDVDHEYPCEIDYADPPGRYSYRSELCRAAVEYLATAPLSRNQFAQLVRLLVNKS